MHVHHRWAQAVTLIGDRDRAVGDLATHQQARAGCDARRAAGGLGIGALAHVWLGHERDVAMNDAGSLHQMPM